MGNEPTKLEFPNYSEYSTLTDEELIPLLHGGLREINLA